MTIPSNDACDRQPGTWGKKKLTIRAVGVGEKYLLALTTDGHLYYSGKGLGRPTSSVEAYEHNAIIKDLTFQNIKTSGSLNMALGTAEDDVWVLPGDLSEPYKMDLGEELNDFNVRSLVVGCDPHGFHGDESPRGEACLLLGKGKASLKDDTA